MMFPRLYAVLPWDRATQITFPLQSLSENNNKKPQQTRKESAHNINISVITLCNKISFESFFVYIYISIRCLVAPFCTWGWVEKGHYQQTGSAFCTCLDHFHTTISVTVSLSVHSLHSCWCISPSLLHSSKHRCVRWCCPRTLSWRKGVWLGGCLWLLIFRWWGRGWGQQQTSFASIFRPSNTSCHEWLNDGRTAKLLTACLHWLRSERF